MSNYDFDNPWEEKDSSDYQGNSQPQYSQNSYSQYSPYQSGVAPAVVPESAVPKRNLKKELALIIPLLVLVAVVGFVSIKQATKGTSVLEATFPDLTTVVTLAPATTVPVFTEQTTVPPTTAAVPSTESSSTETTTAAPVTESTAMAVVTESTTQQTTVQVSETTSTAPAVTEPSEEEILKAVSDGINSLKDPAASFTGTKTQKISIKLTECSVAALVDPVNTVLDYFAGDEVFTFDFTNGKATDPETGEEITSAKAIPPTDKPFTLTVDGVADAKYEQVGDNKVYTVTVVPESSNLASPRPPHHNSACDTLDFSAFELPVGEVTKADFEYPGAVISVTIDPNGKIIEYHENLPMKGTGEGKLGITAGGSMEGFIDEKWTIQWK